MDVPLDVEHVARWASQQGDVVAVALVGSYARGEAHPDSDVDLVVLTDDPRRYLDDDAWIEPMLRSPGTIARTQAWGPLTERRVALPSGLEVEIGIARPSWAAIDPVDQGTAGVVRDGCLPIADPEGLLARLIAAVRRGS